MAKVARRMRVGSVLLTVSGVMVFVMATLASDPPRCVPIPTDPCGPECERCCHSDAECTYPGTVCVAGYCVEPAEPGRCRLDEDCPAELGCVGASICTCPDLCEEVEDPYGFCAWDGSVDAVCDAVDVPPLGLDATAVSPTNGTVFWLEASPHDPLLLFAGSGSELYRSDNGGRTWRVVPFPLSHNGTQGLAFHPTNPYGFYAAASYYGDSTLLRSVDGGWTWVTLGLDPSLVVESVATDPSTPERVLVGTHWDGVWESLDEGETFTQTGLTEGIVRHLLVDPTDPQRLYAGCRGNDGFYRSEDGGATWTAPGGPGQSIAALALDPSDPQTLYAVVYGAGRFWDTLYRSRDRGDTWTPLYDGDLGGRGLYGFFADPCDPDKLYLGARNAVVRSLDGGQTWTHQPEGFLATSSVPVYGFGRTPERLFAASEGCGLYESLDEGTTWHHIAGLLCDNAPTLDF